ncbi:TetR/AcrR family transcriptional regulator [Peloplasma aerotolerans]|uniref:TetR/AcrR family transcriptional regulator n=1 Tax=Peloplasma aerotolerans TaxID=3044389 RepID=A0AAW6U6R2_9MOLU|nr:TetR/AcrR family transcriptional regulator [Mariniplasma sp. M4Ah]MDI6453653.1 TetR/AcrR family transcriptional regulator [Mariniplasma sp. M4Ah]
MNELLNYNENNYKKKNRRIIIDKARDLFISEGIHSPTMKDIASAAGISLRSVYNYYQTKDDLAIDIQIVTMEIIKYSFSNYTYNQNITAFQNLENVIEKIFNDLLNNQKAVKYITAFDYYFYNSYPDNRYNIYLNSIKSSNIPMEIVEHALLDKSIYFPKNQAMLTLITIFQSLLAYAQKIIYREKVMLTEDISGKGDLSIFKELILRGIKQ